MSRGVINLWSRYTSFLKSEATPTIWPYRQPLSPHRATIRKTIAYSVFVLLGIIYGTSFTIFPISIIFVMSIPLLFLYGIIAWATPDSATAPTKTMTLLFFSLIAIVALWPNYLAIQLPGMPWISMRRIFGIIYSLSLVYCVSISKTLRQELMSSLRNSKPIYYAMTLFIFIQLLTTFTAYPPLSPLFVVMDHQFTWTAAFFGAAWIFTQNRRASQYANMLLIMALFLSVMGVLELRNQQILWANHIPSFLSVGDEVKGLLTPQFRDGRYRITTTFSVSLAFAEFLALCTPFLINKIFSTDNVLKIAIWGICDILLVIMIFMTTARLGVVGWISAHLVYLMAWSIKRFIKRKTDIVAAAFVFAYPIAASLFLVAMFTVPAVHNRTLGGGSTSLSDDARRVQYHMAPPIILNKPIGYGAGNGGNALGYVSPGGLLTIDSYILSVLLDYGIIGFFVYFGSMLFAAFILIYEYIRDSDIYEESSLSLAAGASIFVFFTTKLVLSQEDNHILFFVLLGMACGLRYRRKIFLQGESMGTPEARLPGRHVAHS